jgi:hypothetical protein
MALIFKNNIVAHTTIQSIFKINIKQYTITALCVGKHPHLST